MEDDLEKPPQNWHGGAMNLFLLAAVPLAAVIFHRAFHVERDAFSDPKAWILGAVWSAGALVLGAFFGKWREFSGSLPGTLAGLTFTDVLILPGLVVGAWILTRPGRDQWELGLWLALGLAFSGLRDFAATSRNYDLTEYFLVPLDRILIVLVLPALVIKALGATKAMGRILWGAAAVLLGWTGALVPVLSYLQWGWVCWIGLGVGLGAAVALELMRSQKKAAPQGSGPSQQSPQITGAGKPEQP
jgi:hypothetical protein